MSVVSSSPSYAETLNLDKFKGTQSVMIWQAICYDETKKWVCEKKSNDWVLKCNKVAWVSKTIKSLCEDKNNDAVKMKIWNKLLFTRFKISFFSSWYKKKIDFITEAIKKSWHYNKRSA